jgi:hypothetical protein
MASLLPVGHTSIAAAPEETSRNMAKIQCPGCNDIVVQLFKLVAKGFSKCTCVRISKR